MIEKVKVTKTVNNGEKQIEYNLYLNDKGKNSFEFVDDRNNSSTRVELKDGDIRVFTSSHCYFTINNPILYAFQQKGYDLYKCLAETGS